MCFFMQRGESWRSMPTEAVADSARPAVNNSYITDYPTKPSLSRLREIGQCPPAQLQSLQHLGQAHVLCP